MPQPSGAETGGQIRSQLLPAGKLPAQVLEEHQLLRQARQVHALAGKPGDQRLGGQDGPDADQVHRVGDVPPADGPVDHHRRLSGEQCGEIYHIGCHRGRQHDADVLAVECGDPILEREDAHQHVAIRSDAAGLIGEDSLAGGSQRLIQEGLADRFAGRRAAALVAGLGGEPRGWNRLQFDHAAAHRLAAGRQQHVPDGLEGVDVGLVEPELLLQPDNRVGPSQRVHAQVPGQMLVVADLGRAGKFNEIVRD